MDISFFSHGKTIHKISAGLRTIPIAGKADEVHENYGLRICAYQRNATGKPRTEINPRKFNFFGLSYLIEGEGWLWNPKTGIEYFLPGNIIITPPDVVHDYGGSRCFHEDSLTFTGKIADTLSHCGIINGGIYYIGKERKLVPIIKKASDPSQKSQIEINMMLQELLITISDTLAIQYDNGKDKNVRTLIQTIQKRPSKWWSIQEMCEYCNLSESQFRRIFFRITGMSPKVYIDRCKMQFAAGKLLGSNDKINQIADTLGYVDPLHFSRRFHSLTGMSPTEYRKLFQLSETEME